MPAIVGAKVAAAFFDKGGAFFNVKHPDFGAVGDGVTDDAAAIQAAINAVPVAGGDILFPAGVYLAGSTLALPTDRSVTLRGVPGSHWNNINGGSYGGSVIRRKAGFTSGPLISQIKSGTPTAFGAALNDLVLDGSGLAGDLLDVQHVNSFGLADVFFVNSVGNGLRVLGPFFNVKISHCRFYELGATGGTPAYGVKFVSDADGAANNVEFTACEWEVGRAGYFHCSDPTGTHPVDQIKFVGGKMEFSGNNEATTPATPFMDINNGDRFTINGLQTVNGQSNGATHIKISNSSHVRLDVQCLTSTATDGLNPQYFVDVASGDVIHIRGTFTRGGGNAGAQVRVNPSATNVTLDPTNNYDSPVGTGVPVKWGSTPSAMERAGHGWTGLQSTTALALGAATVLEGPGRGNSICRVTTGGSAIILSAGNKGDMFAIIHQGTTVPIEFDPTDATSRVYKAQHCTIYPGEVGIFFWDSTLALWVKAISRQHSVQSPAFAASFTPLPLDGEIIEVGALTNNITINDISANHKRKGMIVTFRFLQDGTGGRTVTWNAVYKQAWSDTGNTLNKRSTISFYYDGTNFIQLGAQSPYFS